jgi:hypothetical protein
MIPTGLIFVAQSLLNCMLAPRVLTVVCASYHERMLYCKLVNIRCNMLARVLPSLGKCSLWGRRWREVCSFRPHRENMVHLNMGTFSGIVFLNTTWFPKRWIFCFSQTQATRVSPWGIFLGQICSTFNLTTLNAFFWFLKRWYVNEERFQSDLLD